VLEHLERPSILGSKLAMVTQNERLGRAVEKMKPHPVPNRELQRTVFVVKVAARVLLCLKKPSTHLG
jgi:hypothetical protein